MLSEEQKVINAEQNSNEVITAFNKIPYALINEEISEGIDGTTKDILDELTEIEKYYRVYKKGCKFITEGSNFDYVPSDLRFMLATILINKEARFLFAESPDITVGAKGDLSKTTESVKDGLQVLDDLVTTVLEKNMFEDALLKAAKDCFIGKRVAGLVNFNEEDGITVTFLKSTQFIYETKPGNQNTITKFVAFMILNDSTSMKYKRIFKKKYELVDGVVYLEEKLYDGSGAWIEDVTEYQEVLLDRIPAVVFVNDGLTGEVRGESEVEAELPFENWYSRLSNADHDAERKSMNPTKYFVDLDSNSTNGLSSSAGSIWDLGSDQNLDQPHPEVGMLEPSMNYSESLKVTLDRIKTAAYERLDVPNISLETMQGAITSGKGLKAIYWPLLVRCKEKMKMWGPKLSELIDIIIQGALKYPNTAEMYIEDALSPVPYQIKVVQNNPLLEDEIEEKTMDLSEVESKVMSRKTYMKKWRQLTDTEVEEELSQIALERQVLEDSTFNTNTDDEDEDMDNNGGFGEPAEELPYPVE